MKKRTLAILMILVLATAGLFAVPTVTIPGDVTASLQATIGEYFYHGFTTGNVGDTPNAGGFYAAKTITDAFNATPPSFTYGYKTNAANSTFSLKMTVADFLNGSSGVVKIEGVTVSGAGALTQVGRDFELFTFTGNGVDNTAQKTISIVPFLTFNNGDTDITGAVIVAANAVNGAPAGAYQSLITFKITGA
ncbi:MAG: hypothetical protein JEY71_03060 [Sphaerochaeta sp.]|nr:hypothetical protein [Sphaerochaeta sp.]